MPHDYLLRKSIIVRYDVYGRRTRNVRTYVRAVSELSND